MSRRNAREIVYKLTFEFLFYEQANDTTMDLLMLDSTLTDDDKEYVKRVYGGIIFNYEELVGLIEKYSIGFVTDRIYKPDMAALLLSAYELKYEKDIPAAVSISSAVELVKRYSSEKSNSFVNGILSSINKYLKGEIQ